MSRKEVGAYGEEAVALYLKRRGHRIVERNVARKTGEIDIISRKGKTLHFVEVKTVLCRNFPNPMSSKDRYDPSVNLHPAKIRRVARTSEWYMANIAWNGDCQVDAALVWVRARDGQVRVSYIPQILKD